MSAPPSQKSRGVRQSSRRAPRLFVRRQITGSAAEVKAIRPGMHCGIERARGDMDIAPRQGSNALILQQYRPPHNRENMALSQTKKQLSNGTPSLLKMEIWMRNIIWHTAIRTAVVLNRIWIKLAQFILSWQIAVISWRKLHCQKWNFPSKQRMDCCFSENNGGIRD